MTETITRIFSRYDEAVRAVDALRQHGIAEADISIIAHAESVPPLPDTAGENPATATGTGAGLGGVLGAGAGLLAGIGALAIPGLGPVVAAGWLAATAAGAAAGAVTGGMVGALADAGIPESQANVFAEAVRHGGILLMVRTDHPAEAERIIARSASIAFQQLPPDFHEAAWPSIRDTDLSRSNTRPL